MHFRWGRTNPTTLMVIVARIKNLLRELNRTSVDIIPRGRKRGWEPTQDNRSWKIIKKKPPPSLESSVAWKLPSVHRSRVEIGMNYARLCKSNCAKVGGCILNIYMKKINVSRRTRELECVGKCSHPGDTITSRLGDVFRHCPIGSGCRINIVWELECLFGNRDKMMVDWVLIAEIFVLLCVVIRHCW